MEPIATYNSSKNKKLYGILLAACLLALSSGGVWAVPANAGFSAAVIGTVTIPANQSLPNVSSLNFSGNWAATFVPQYYTPEDGPTANNDFYGTMIPFGTNGSIAATLDLNSFSPIDDFLKWYDSTNTEHTFDLLSIVREPSAAGAIFLVGEGIYSSQGFDTTFATFYLFGRNVGQNNISASFFLGTRIIGTASTNNTIPSPSTLMLIGLILITFSLWHQRRLSWRLIARAFR